jgi:hypothetical protein
MLRRPALSIFERWRSRNSARASRGAAVPEAGPLDYENRLIERKTMESIERENTRRAVDFRKVDRRSPERVAALLKPFGYANGEWEALKNTMQPGDEFWTFASSPASWRALAGRAGLALVRDGKIVATIVTMLN